MKEKLLLKIAIICSLVGIVILFLIAQSIKIDEEDIGKINREDIDDEVIVAGRITKIIDTEEVMILEVSKNEEISVVLFKESLIDLQEGDNIEVRGKVAEYEGDIEIMGDEVRVIS